MRTAGVLAFEARRPDRTALSSLEQRASPSFSRDETRRFRANKAAWAFFASQPPGYRRIATFYVVSAKREETRARRLDRLVDD